MLWQSQPAYHTALQAVQAGDVGGLRRALSGTASLNDRDWDRGWWERDSWFTKLPMLCLCPGPPYACQKCSCFGEFEYVTLGCCPSQSKPAMLEADNYDLYHARRAIRDGDATNLVKVLARQPRPREFVEAKMTVATKPQREVMCHDQDCYDCLCVGVDRCEDGLPRRWCGDVTAHFPFLFVLPFPILRCPAQISHWSEDAATGSSIKELVEASGDSALIAAAKEVNVEAFKAGGQALIKSMDGTEVVLSLPPGRATLATMKELAMREHPRLKGTAATAFDLMYMNTAAGGGGGGGGGGGPPKAGSAGKSKRRFTTRIKAAFTSRRSKRAPAAQTVRTLQLERAARRDVFTRLLLRVKVSGVCVAAGARCFIFMGHATNQPHTCLMIMTPCTMHTNPEGSWCPGWQARRERQEPNRRCNIRSIVETFSG